MSNEAGGLFISGLQLLFIGLKLTNNIDWSWWVVFTPFISIFILAFFLAVFIVFNKGKDGPKIIGDKI